MKFGELKQILKKCKTQESEQLVRVVMLEKYNEYMKKKHPNKSDKNEASGSEPHTPETARLQPYPQQSQLDPSMPAQDFGRDVANQHLLERMDSEVNIRHFTPSKINPLDSVKNSSSKHGGNKNSKYASFDSLKVNQVNKFNK